MFFAISLVMSAMLVLLKIVGVIPTISWLAIIGLPFVGFLITALFVAAAMALEAATRRRRY